MRFLLLLAVVCSAAAQAPVVGDIEFYGLHKVTPEHILSALKLKSGDPLPPSKGDMLDVLENVPNVVLGRIEAVCCDGPHATLFIGVEERGAPHTALRSEPTGIIFLVLAPYNQNKAIRFHAFQSIFFHVACILFYFIFSFVLSIILSMMHIFGLFFLTQLVGLGFFLVWLYLIISAYQGKNIELPIIGPIARQQA